MRRLVMLCCGLLAGIAQAATPVSIERGSFRFVPLDDQKEAPQRYRLPERDFIFELEHKNDLPAIGVSVHRLRFPSPVVSETPENNTVHAEYYRPMGKGPFPAVIVLDITGGNQMLSRHIATYLAQEGVAGLFVQMAYYGPRRPPGSKLRLMSPNISHTVAAVTQTVLDMRVAAAWLASRPEVDADRLGITGTSLGSFISALSGAMEPRLRKVCVLLGGGGFVDGYTNHPLVRPYATLWSALGGNLNGLRKLINPVDPLTYAENLKKRKLLILAASQDEIVPPSMARWLWESSGKQQIHWYNAGHYTAVLYLADALERVLHHFKNP